MAVLRRARRLLVPAVLVVVVLAGLGVVAGAGSALLRGPTWSSSAQLLWDPSVRAGIDPTYSPPDSQAFDRQVADQQDVVMSDAVVGRVARAIDQPAAEVRDEVTVTATSGSATFTIAASGPTAEQARAVARATTSAYIATLQAQNETLLQSRVTSLSAQVTSLRRQLASSAGGALATSLADVQTQLAAAQAALQDVPVEASVQRAAAVPSAPSSLSLGVQAVVGGGLGAVLGICVLLALWARRTREVTTGAAARDLRPAERPASAAARLAPMPAAPAADDPPYFEESVAPVDTDETAVADLRAYRDEDGSGAAPSPGADPP